ncbi:MAG: DegT/DnrJ/EryC1/StrS family aminotransferase [Candidatus Latescibacterota bacterium]|nr:DegT/DnrJ/EryC1/StrS family aminotransferase [Candidatus Latescibacterota bacterium]
MIETVQLFKPWYGEAEYEALRRPLETGWLGYGPLSRKFEDQFADYIGADYAIALNSCTAALHLAFLAAEITSGEVISTPMTFVASNHAILIAGARPVFCDIEADTLNINVEDVASRITSETKAILAVHYGGHSCEMARLRELSDHHGLFLIEDVAQACGGAYRGQKLGTFGDIGCFSFESKKNLSTGDGGMLVTNNDILAERVRKLRWLGISRDTWSRFNKGESSRAWEYDVEEVGFKYSMNDIAASLGLVQLHKLESANERRRNIVDRYHEALSKIDGIEPLAKRDYSHSACYSMVVRLNERESLYDFLSDRGIESAVHYFPNHLLPLYKPYRLHALPVVEREWKRILTLPLSPHLRSDQFDRVINALHDFSALQSGKNIET